MIGAINKGPQFSGPLFIGVIHILCGMSPLTVNEKIPREQSGIFVLYMMLKEMWL